MKNVYTSPLLFIFVLYSTFIFGQNQDCLSSTKLCEKATFHFTEMLGKGSVDESQHSLKCSNSFNEINSLWLRWDILKEGTLTFVIDPIDREDDLDFILYKVNSACKDLTEVRCMASGKTYGDSHRDGQPCEGRTGLSLASLDEFEVSGCKYNDDNYLKFLQTEAGEEYVLFVNNFSSPKGFSITFEGTSEFRKQDACLTVDDKDYINITEVFPNPALEEISVIYTKVNNEPIDIQVLNLQGQIVWSKESLSINTDQQEIINVADFASGTYLVRIIQGALSSTKQFIKQ